MYIPQALKFGVLRHEHIRGQRHSNMDGLLRCTRAMQAFEFDRVFGPESTQKQIFNDVAQLVTSALDGYNVCIFAYGQTGACESLVDSQGVTILGCVRPIFRHWCARRCLKLARFIGVGSAWTKRRIGSLILTHQWTQY